MREGQQVDRLIERAIAVRGGEALVYNNTIKGYRFGGAINIGDLPWGDSYPIPYSVGYLSGLALGSNHSGTNSTQGRGDMFYWGNKFTPYGDPTDSKDFYNYNPQYFIQGRDYHLVPKPGYVPYTYPHPFSIIAD